METILNITKNDEQLQYVFYQQLMCWRQFSQSKDVFL